ncbi:hypothetical protein G9F32_16035 [Acinetobacter sp. 194]|uniref:NucA/NucB deoxyribonuclease domain-containing protein n=1 Tax=Acinetobacter shaoyimingii TaxID=2715164 RepID=UPI00140E285A|nr:NucA/NucB deoxyribonuclease domain-containing protein [Acinetobacter shaoyimingii]NHB59505.1 hypothetical protein [Acinetobacter shaoyimingii]
MNKFIYISSALLCLSIGQATYATNEPNHISASNENNVKNPILLGALNTIITTAQAVQLWSEESAPDVSPACEVVGQPNNRLRSRNSFCQNFDKTLDLYDEQGAYVNTAHVIGYAYTDDDQPTNTLDWPLKFKFRTTYTNPAGPLAQISPFLECGTADNDNLCTTLVRSTTILNPGLSGEIQVVTRLNMRGLNKYTFDTMELRANYSVLSQPVEASTHYLIDSNIPALRCDVNLARSNSKGCIFEEAPAVLTRISIYDPDVDESALHIRDALASGKPGLYVSEDYNIQPNWQSSPLTRLRDLSARTQNRKYSLDKCLAQYNSYSPTCAPSGDPEDPEVNCDCDEYPFAATNEGGESSDASVRKIDPSDNRRAGAYLGAFFTQQRVIDGEKFYIKVE